MMAGGFAEGRPAGDKERDLLALVKGQVEGKLGRSYGSLEALEVKTQVVAGLIYKIKVKADAECLHVKLFEPLGGEAPQLQDAQVKTEADAL